MMEFRFQLLHAMFRFLHDVLTPYSTEICVYDYNLIIEEFNFYNELPAHIQNQISESLFRSFKIQYGNFFESTDIGFQH